MKLRLLMKFITVGCIALWLFTVEAMDSINLGYGGLNPMPHCETKIYNVEYEHLYSSSISALVRGSVVNYKSDDGAYRENGKIRGLDIGARYYFAPNMHGVFTGGSLGYWSGDWPFVQDINKPSERQGSAKTHALRLNFDIGYRIPIHNTNISIRPEINLGKFFSSHSCEYTTPASRVGTYCEQESEVDYYLFAGIAVGIAF